VGVIHALRERGSKMKRENDIIDKLKALLLTMGFEEIIITNPYRSETNYVRGSLHCIPQYIERLGFLIEYADSYEEAKNHLHEDGDLYPLEMGEEAILTGLENELRQQLT
jgi:hypothetical protein